MKTQGENSHPNARDGGLRGAQLCQHLHLGPSASGIARQWMCLLSGRSMVLCSGRNSSLVQASRAGHRLVTPSAVLLKGLWGERRGGEIISCKWHNRQLGVTPSSDKYLLSAFWRQTA